jgi:hypothetical protein
MYIYKALLHHGYGAFSLAILEYIDISHLSKEDARKLVLSKEQYYLDTLSPHYNINPIAGSRLGSQHTKETKALMSFAKAGENHPMFGRTLPTETLDKISATKGTLIFQFDTKGILVNTFSSARQAATNFNCSKTTIKKYAINGELFQDKWTLFVCKSLSDCNQKE